MFTDLNRFLPRFPCPFEGLSPLLRPAVTHRFMKHGILANACLTGQRPQFSSNEISRLEFAPSRIRDARAFGLFRGSNHARRLHQGGRFIHQLKSVWFCMLLREAMRLRFGLP